MSWSVVASNIKVGDLEEVLNEAVASAPQEQFQLEEHTEQAALAVELAGKIIDDGALGELGEDSLVTVTMSGHATEDHSAGNSSMIVSVQRVG